MGCALPARNAELEEALEPFADACADQVTWVRPEDDCGYYVAGITLASCRRAHRLLGMEDVGAL